LKQILNGLYQYESLAFGDIDDAVSDIDLLAALQTDLGKSDQIQNALLWRRNTKYNTPATKRYFRIQKILSDG
jgi:hypothetical protein